MGSKKLSKTTKRDEDRQKRIEERIKAEKVELGHPKGKERFAQIIKRIGKKKSS